MIWAQISSGRKLHLAGQPGDEVRGEVVRTGFLSHPLCNQPMTGSYRMTCNLPLGNGCKKCRRIAARLS
jgi:hypothetical protein